MAWRLHYFALEIVAGRPVRVHAFECATEAEEGARIISRMADGVIAFQQWGNDTTGEWDAPDPLIEFGAVPLGAVGDPAEVVRLAS